MSSPPTSSLKADGLATTAAPAPSSASTTTAALVLQCLGTNRLRGGQISVQGFVDISAEGALQPFKLGITGGTQRYHKAHGQVVGTPISETELDLRFHIR